MAGIGCIPVVGIHSPRCCSRLLGKYQLDDKSSSRFKGEKNDVLVLLGMLRFFRIRWLTFKFTVQTPMWVYIHEFAIFSLVIMEVLLRSSFFVLSSYYVDWRMPEFLVGRKM